MAYSKRPDIRLDVRDLAISEVTDPHFFLEKANNKVIQSTQIFRTTFLISKEMMEAAKSKEQLENACQSEAFQNHVALINHHLVHSTKSHSVTGRGLPLRTMMGLRQMVDAGVDVSGGLKLIALKGRAFKLIRHDPGYHWYGRVPGLDYHTFEFVSEVALGLVDDEREARIFQHFCWAESWLKMGRTLG